MSSSIKTVKAKFNPAEISVVLGEPNNYARAMITEVLRNLGYQKIYSAANAAEVVDAVCVWHPRVIILENLLPDMSGTELVSRLRRDANIPDRSVPVIMVTGDPRLETVKEARMAGVDEFAAKPVSHQVIKERMDEVLLRPRPFIEAKKYVGPCRRRKRTLEYRGSLKRISDPIHTTDDKVDVEMNMRMLERCAEQIHSMARAIDPKNRTEVRTLFNTSAEANEIAKRLRDEALELATYCVTRYIAGVGASGDLQTAVISAHMDALRLLMGGKKGASDSDRLEIAKGLKTIVQQKLREAV